MEAQLEQLLAKSQNVELMKLNIEQAVLDQELAASMHVGASAIRASGMYVPPPLSPHPHPREGL